MRITSLAMVTMLLVPLLAVMFSSPVYAYACNVTSTTYNYPQQVTLGQQIAIATVLSGSCYQPIDIQDYYSARVDITDVSLGQVISSNSTSLGYGPPYPLIFSTAVVNHVKAPSTQSKWSLQISLSIFVSGGSAGPDYSTIGFATLQVGPLTILTSVTTETQVLMSTIQPLVTVTSTETVQQGVVDRSLLQIMVSLLALAVAIAAFIFYKRRSKQPVDRTRVY